MSGLHRTTVLVFHCVYQPRLARIVLLHLRRPELSTTSLRQVQIVGTVIAALIIMDTATAFLIRRRKRRDNGGATRNNNTGTEPFPSHCGKPEMCGDP